MSTGVDMEFLRAAAAIAKGSIYSLHKSSTRDHIAKVATKQLGLEAEVIAQLRYDLPNTYSFHRYCSGRCVLQFSNWRGGVSLMRERARWHGHNGPWELVRSECNSRNKASQAHIMLAQCCRQKSKDIEVDLWRFTQRG